MTESKSDFTICGKGEKLYMELKCKRCLFYVTISIYIYNESISIRNRQKQYLCGPIQ